MLGYLLKSILTAFSKHPTELKFVVVAVVDGDAFGRFLLVVVVSVGFAVIVDVGVVIGSRATGDSFPINVSVVVLDGVKADVIVRVTTVGDSV